MKPPLACRNCRARKKKCDRAYPVCSYCLRTHDRCEYRIDGHTSQLTRPVVSLDPPPNVIDATLRVCYNAAMFLGYPQQSLPRPPPHHSSTVGPEVAGFVYGAGPLEKQEWVTHFIRCVDPWMPFIPLKDFHSRLLNESAQLKAEDVLLLACIKLNSEPLQDNQPINKSYLAIKSNFVSAEIYGTLSVGLLQALLMLLIYEYGHGIYPSAYTTLGSCARYLSALDITTGTEQDQAMNQPGDWMDKEMRRRLWWFVYVMDRIMGLGCPQRPLLLKEPNEDQLLPSDDISWQQEYPLPFPQLTILSPPRSNMGTFRLLVHAAFLVGRVFQFLAERREGLDAMPSRRTQLYRTIIALTNVLEIELQTTLVAISVARCTLHAAIFILYSYDDPNDPDYKHIHDLSHPMSISAHTCLELTKIYLSGDLTSAQRASPFLLTWGFRCLKYFYDRYQLDGHRDSLESLNVLRRGLEALGDKWKLADVYAVLMNGNQISPPSDMDVTTA